jgi:hypothetical protein
MSLPDELTPTEKAFLRMRTARNSELASLNSDFHVVKVGVDAEMLDNLMRTGLLRERDDGEAVRGAVMRFLRSSLTGHIEYAH